MIKSENGEVDIDGTRANITVEFMELYEFMIEEAPEIVAAVIVNHDKELKTSVAALEVDIFSVTDEFVKSIIKARKELK